MLADDTSPGLLAMKSAHVTDAELNVLQALWQRGPSAIRQLTDELYGEGNPSHYATVKKLLERLEAKGIVRRDRTGPVHRFEAIIGRDELIERRLHEVARTFCRGSLAPLLSQLVRLQSLSKEQRDELRRLIDDADRPEQD